MCINMHVGELVPEWLGAMKRQSEELRTLAGDGSARLFNQFYRARHGCPQAK